MWSLENLTNFVVKKLFGKLNLFVDELLDFVVGKAFIIKFLI